MKNRIRRTIFMRRAAALGLMLFLAAPAGAFADARTDYYGLYLTAEEAGDEERLEALVGDWVAEARVLERVKRLGGEAGEALEREWAERIIPWTTRQEVRHLTDPRRGA